MNYRGILEHGNVRWYTASRLAKLRQEANHEAGLEPMTVKDSGEALANNRRKENEEQLKEKRCDRTQTATGPEYHIGATVQIFAGYDQL